MLHKNDVYLFNEGTNYRSYKLLGCHAQDDGAYRFAVWAPNAEYVSLIGEFNGWDENNIPMKKYKNSGIWYAISGIPKQGQLYKYFIRGKNGKERFKADPYAFRSEENQGTASVVYTLEDFEWKDEAWQKKRRRSDVFSMPMSIYELNLASWQTGEDNNALDYRETARRLCEYVKEMNFTHVELMPINEFPYDGSWGYQVTGYFSVTNRFGRPEDFMYFVNLMHENDIGVIVDWVPAHFPRDDHGLRLFDGSPLYEYADPRIGEHKEWGTLVFDFGKPEVRSFLISSAMLLIEKYHIDGIRVDAVSSMIYRDYNRKEGEWIRNDKGGNENEEATEFLRQLNKCVLENHPGVLMIAEESTSWPMVTLPPHTGGLGFNYKWNMGWMNDMLRYMSSDPYYRKYNHNLLTFSMVYAFSENFILPLSHDEVVHGKKSLLNKMPGEYNEKFANLRAMYAYMFAHPGKKLIFMGGEFGQFIEWKFDAQLDWNLLEYEMHSKLKLFFAALNGFYRQEKSLYRIENGWEGFKWINTNDNEKSVISFMRMGKRKGERLIVISNFTPVKREHYTVGVPVQGEYEEVFSSGEERFGGTSRLRTYKAQKKPADGFLYSIQVHLDGLTTTFLKKKKKN